MKVDVSYSFDTDPQSLWSALLSPKVLASCIPGCERLESAGEGSYEVVLKVGVGPVTGTYTGRISVTDQIFPRSYKMTVEGRGSAGSIKGEAAIRFVEGNGGTVVKIVGEARVSGVVARVGQQQLGSTSEMLMNQFFDCLRSTFDGG